MHHEQPLRDVLAHLLDVAAGEEQIAGDGGNDSLSVLADDGEVRADNGEVRLCAEKPRDRGSIAGNERTLEPRLGGEGGGRPVGVLQLFLIRGERRSETRLKTGVDGTRLRARRDRGETPESGRQRQQRQQHEVGDEFELETTHGFPSSDRPPLPIALSVRVVGY